MSRGAAGPFVELTHHEYVYVWNGPDSEATAEILLAAAAAAGLPASVVRVAPGYDGFWVPGELADNVPETPTLTLETNPDGQSTVVLGESFETELKWGATPTGATPEFTYTVNDGAPQTLDYDSQVTYRVDHALGWVPTDGLADGDVIEVTATAGPDVSNPVTVTVDGSVPTMTVDLTYDETTDTATAVASREPAVGLYGSGMNTQVSFDDGATWGNALGEEHRGDSMTKVDPVTFTNAIALTAGTKIRARTSTERVTSNVVTPVLEDVQSSKATRTTGTNGKKKGTTP